MDIIIISTKEELLDCIVTSSLCINNTGGEDLVVTSAHGQNTYFVFLPLE